MTRLEHLTLDESLERAGDGAFAVGADGRILSWNRAAERILGFTARQVLGRPCCEVFAGRDDRDNLLCYQGCHVRTLVSMGESVQNFDMRVRTKAGRLVWINVSVLTAGRQHPGGPVSVHLFRDVTATKELLTLVHERLAGPPAETSGTLTRREVEILRLIAGGVRTRDAAAKLHVSTATVRNHVQNILAKLGVHSRLEAVAYAHRHRLL